MGTGRSAFHSPVRRGVARPLIASQWDRWLWLAPVADTGAPLDRPAQTDRDEKERVRACALPSCLSR
jgi:hypothetical protein